MTPRWAVLILLAAAGVLGGCSWTEKKFAPDTVSLADRCADIMKRAISFAPIEIGAATSKGVDVRTIVADVSATRTDLAATEAARDLAVECTFVDNMLTAFSWTKGGPPAPK